MDLCNELCLSGWLASPLHGKKINIGHYTQTLQTKFFIPAMLSSTFDFLHTCHAYRHHWLLLVIPLSLTLTLPGGHKVSAKQNLRASFFPILIWLGCNVAWGWNNSSWTSWKHFWVRFMKRREITAVLLTALKNTFNMACILTFVNQFDSNVACWYIQLFSTFWC